MYTDRARPVLSSISRTRQASAAAIFATVPVAHAVITQPCIALILMLTELVARAPFTLVAAAPVRVLVLHDDARRPHGHVSLRLGSHGKAESAERHASCQDCSHLYCPSDVAGTITLAVPERLLHKKHTTRPGRSD